MCVIISLLFSFIFSSLCVSFFSCAEMEDTRVHLELLRLFDRTGPKTTSFAATFRKRTRRRRRRRRERERDNSNNPRWRRIGLVVTCHRICALRAHTHTEPLIKAASIRFCRDFSCLSPIYSPLFFFLVSLFLVTSFLCLTVVVVVVVV